MFSWLQFMTRMHMRITVYEIQTSFYNLSSGEVSQSLVMGQCNKIMHFATISMDQLNIVYAQPDQPQLTLFLFHTKPFVWSLVDCIQLQGQSLLMYNKPARNDRKAWPHVARKLAKFVYDPATKSPPLRLIKRSNCHEIICKGPDQSLLKIVDVAGILGQCVVFYIVLWQVHTHF